MELMFYHLQQQPLERVLPVLIEKTLERGWKAVVEVASPERQRALDDLLWTYAERSFLPHGTDLEAGHETQPVLITTARGNANGAEVRFLVDGARLGDDLRNHARIALLFDGNDPVALEHARADWKRAKAAGASATYWQQSGEGRWEKKA